MHRSRGALWAVAAVLVVGGLLWATGGSPVDCSEACGRTRGSRRWDSSLARFHAHAGDPALAWPAPERALIPGPIPFYSRTLAVLLVPIASGRFCSSDIGRERRSTRSRCALGKTRDLRAVSARRDPAAHARRIDGHLIAAEPRESVIVIGPTQSGKTTGFAIPAILEWQGPVLATSIKSDLLNDTYAARSTIPDADFLIYDPTHSTGYATAGWTPCRLRDLAGSSAGRVLARRCRPRHERRDRERPLLARSRREAPRAASSGRRSTIGSPLATSSSGSTRKMRTSPSGASRSRGRPLRTHSPPA